MLGLCGAGNALLVGVALMVPPLVLRGLDSVLEFALLMFALTLLAALLPRRTGAMPRRIGKADAPVAIEGAAR